MAENPIKKRTTGNQRFTSKTPIQTVLNELGNVPPHEIALEEVVLGAMMLERDALTEVIDFLTPEVFYDERHQKIFQAIREIFQRSEPVDLMSVVAELRKQGTLEFVGGAVSVAKLTEKVNSSANIVFHARILQQYYIKRELIRIAGEIRSEAFEDTSDVFELLDRTQQALFDISEKNIRKNYEPVSSIMQKLVYELDALRKRKDGLSGVPSGFTKLDKITSGFQKSTLVVVAARPGMGKTAFMLSIARNAAILYKKPIGIFSLEMSQFEIMQRLCSAEAEIRSEKFRTGQFDEAEWQRFVHNTARLAQAPIFIDDTSALSILELRAKARKLKKQHNIQMIIIDYLQLMHADTGKLGNREQEIAFISRSLKQIAKELEIPVIALSQLSRATEAQGSSKRPMLSHLRESGSIEQDADIVMFLYRPEYYGITEDENGNPTKNICEVIVAKHRAGGLDTVPLKFISAYTKFENLEEFDGFSSHFSSESHYSVSTNMVKMPSRMNDAREDFIQSSKAPFFEEDPPF
ncbi:MAG: replicative DNA helicase [Cytophagales bacterium]|nr:replicative DNA helicase [Cytophagales bacterium]MDW8384125.1 replicative DNA helicase [Flammeovirgaceae bacterium]